MSGYQRLGHSERLTLKGDRFSSWSSGLAQVMERVAGDEARRVKTGVMIRDDERLSSFFGVDSVKLSSVGVTVASMLICSKGLLSFFDDELVIRL